MRTPDERALVEYRDRVVEALDRGADVESVEFVAAKPPPPAPAVRVRPTVERV